MTPLQPAIIRINSKSGGLELLVSPVWGPTNFFDSFSTSQLDKIFAIQDKLTLLILKWSCICLGVV